MKPRRVSIAKMMFLVGVVAVNIALLRQLIDGNNPAIVGAAGVLLMANILAFGLYRLLFDPGKRSSFLVGFEVAGLVSILGFLVITWVFPDPMFELLIVALEPLHDICLRYLPSALMVDWNSRESDAQFISARIIMALMLTPVVAVAMALPQLILAVAGGLLARPIARWWGNAPGS